MSYYFVLLINPIKAPLVLIFYKSKAVLVTLFIKAVHPQYKMTYYSTFNKYSMNKKIRMLKKLIHWKQLDNAEKSCKIKKGANLYAFEYMKINAGKYVKVKDVQEYCNEKTKQKTGSPLGDPPRAFEILRKDKLPLEWDEYIVKGCKYVKYNPNKKQNICQYIIDTHKHKSDSFDKNIILQKLQLSNYKCAITGIPESDGGLAADHFIPKEKGGQSVIDNCIILNKILNEKKNKKMPIEWFCETLLTNFMNICKNMGNLQECKEQLIHFIKDF